MEDLNEIIGESESAFFRLQTFKENQTLTRCFRPPTVQQLYLDTDLGNLQKKDNEIRFVITDFAFANTTTRQKNDNTQIMCMSLHWRDNRFERHVDYMEQFAAGDSLGATDRVRELVYDYNADYYICDLRNGGEALYNYISQPRDNPQRGSFWNPHGFGVSPKIDYQVVPETKLADLRSRTVDKAPQDIVIPIVGNAEFNSLAWIALKKQLELGNIKFLMSMHERQEVMEDNGEYFALSGEDLATELAPYGEVDLLIKECIELKTEYHNDKIKLIEPRGGTKDRAVILAYGNYIASLIENEWLRQDQEEEIDYDDIQFVF